MSADDIAEMLALHADMHWQDAHPGVTATPMERLRAWLDHEAAPCADCHETGRVAAPGTGHLPGGHPDTNDITCPTCGGG